MDDDLVDGSRRNASLDGGEPYRPRVTVAYGDGMRPSRADVEDAINNDLSIDHDLDILLAQAQHFAISEVFNPDSNHSLAIYLAALACEVKIKRVLHRDTPDEKQSALNERVPMHRQFDGHMQSLYSSVALEFLGRSLKRDIPTTFRGLTELFERRNDFTHQAKPVTVEQAWELTELARRAVRWAVRFPRHGGQLVPLARG